MKEKNTGETRDHRWIMLSGFVFIAAWVGGLLITFPPAITAPIANLVAYYQANGGMAMAQVYVANGLTGMALIVFTAALHSVLRRDEGRSSTLSSILLGSGMVVASLSCLEALFVQVLANRIAVTGDGTVIRTLLELNTEIDTFKFPVLGIMIGATSLLIWRSGGFPRWLAWGGAIEVCLLVAAIGSPLSNSQALTVILYISGVGLLLWVALVSIMVGRRGRAS